MDDLKHENKTQVGHAILDKELYHKHSPFAAYTVIRVPVCNH